MTRSGATFKGGETVHAVDEHRLLTSGVISLCGVTLSMIHDEFNQTSAYACKKCVAALRKGMPLPRTP